MSKLNENEKKLKINDLKHRILFVKTKKMQFFLSV